MLLKKTELLIVIYIVHLFFYKFVQKNQYESTLAMISLFLAP